jgi:hypothetical protein
MHDGSVADADRWLKANLGQYANWALYHNSLLIVTWDEGAGGADNHIPTIFYGANVRKGHPQLAENHYRLLRTIEGIYHLPPLGEAGFEAPLYRVFKSPVTTQAIIPIAATAITGASPMSFSTQPIDAEASSAWKRLEEPSA